MAIETVRLGPVSRISDDMNVQVAIDAGKVVDAHVAGTVARGFEVILRGKDPRDAVILSQRICGVCPAPHAVASALALDDLTDASIPRPARLVRNLILGASHLASHIVSFYLATLQDYIDPTAVAAYGGDDERLQLVARKVGALLGTGDGAPFTPRYASDESCLKDPNSVAGLLANYFDALLAKRKAETMTAIFAGRHPHICSVVPGGVTIPVTESQITQFQYALQELGDWIERVMLPDAQALAAGPAKPLAGNGFGVGHSNFLSYGAFDLITSGDYKNRLLPSGVIVGADVANWGRATVQDLDPAKIAESLRFGWYTDAYEGKSPRKSITEFSPGKANAYTFAKAPRYDGKPMEVGPLARMMVKKDSGFQRLVRKAGVTTQSVPARLLARAYEAKLIARAMVGWLDSLLKAIADREDICDEKPFPDTGEAAGLLDAPRGALGHWITLDAGIIDTYQVVSPSTWNASPRDPSLVRGPIEEALVGTPVPDAANPLNVLRVVRSFDPCLTCAVHVLDGSGRSLTRIG